MRIKITQMECVSMVALEGGKFVNISNPDSDNIWYVFNTDVEYKVGFKTYKPCNDREEHIAMAMSQDILADIDRDILNSMNASVAVRQPKQTVVHAPALPMIPSFTMQISSIASSTRKLKGTWTIESEQDLKAWHGIEDGPGFNLAYNGKLLRVIDPIEKKVIRVTGKIPGHITDMLHDAIRKFVANI